MHTLSIITTLNHNIGDDFVREGIVHLIQEITPFSKIELIHKHSPVTSVFHCENVRDLRASRVLEPLLRFFNVRNRITDADVLVQSGAPVYWCHPNGPHCADNEWFEPIIRKRFLNDRRDRKFLNIAAGSCQRYYSGVEEINICPKCKSYIAEFFDACDLTLLRDELAKKILNLAGRDADVLPCTSIFARDHYKIAPKIDGYVVVNFMEHGGHYVFDETIDAGKWRKHFELLVKKLSSQAKVIAACHSATEKKLVQQVIPSIETYTVPNDKAAFMNFYAGARFGIVNRVHAGFIMASFGKPVAVIGNDSRALMIRNLNLASYYVDDVDEELIDQMIQELLLREKSYKDEIEEIRKAAHSNYVEKISKVLLG